MDDYEIIKLYRNRDEEAIKETAKKYSSYCFAIGKNILDNHEDVEECVNDTYLKVWQAIPPAVPDNFRIFVGIITRRLSLNMFKKNKAQKRNFGRVNILLDELNEVIEDPSTNMEMQADGEEIVKAINVFLTKQPKLQRMVFVRRYWHVSSIKEIANEYGISEANTKQILFRTRKKLRKHLESEGIKI
ncbi:sigma-70 family RNA polymerase sigma factor [Acidaminobacter sp. JC074]|uniref:RNA polymerase sigma factor n=1 Tax=Acidaminobacter sp. JC074 TaxID=2530199 RepID=UPI001F0ECA0B|nr:sigma-70 family RNA polymerase sigma factor [Acidaminobacter sp. JC074]MCH4887651.1 sigma-70 family RNA polymerase sigma factor [Acidaminobacter sp. JC074]